MKTSIASSRVPSRPIFLVIFFLFSVLSSSFVFAIGGEFTLTADDENRYSLSDSRGKVVVISFGYTFCPDICPTALATIGLALNEMGKDAERVEALFVSLDPDRDTTERLRSYTEFFHPQLTGLTGSADELKQVAEQYNVFYGFVGKGTTERYSMDHSANLYILDTHGRLSSMLPHGMPPSALVNSIRQAMRNTESINDDNRLNRPAVSK